MKSLVALASLWVLALGAAACARAGSESKPAGKAVLPAVRGDSVAFAAWDEGALELRLRREACEGGRCRGYVDLVSSGRPVHSLELGFGVFPDGPIKLGAASGGAERTWSLEGTPQTLANNHAAGAALFASREVHLGKAGRAVYLSHTWVPPAEGLPVTVHRVVLVEPRLLALAFEVRDPGYEGLGTVEVRDADNDGVDEIALSKGSFDLPQYPGKLTFHWDGRQKRYTPE